MAALWFYRPTRMWRKALTPILGEWSHVGIAHTVADLAVLTEAHPIIGVWCSVQSRVTAPDAKVLVDIPDEFTTRWLVQRWGVKYDWYNPADLPSHPRVKTHIWSSRLAHMFLVDANKAGFPVQNSGSFLAAHSLSTSDIYRLIAPA